MNETDDKMKTAVNLSDFRCEQGAQQEWRTSTYTTLACISINRGELQYLNKSTEHLSEFIYRELSLKLNEYARMYY